MQSTSGERSYGIRVWATARYVKAVMVERVTCYAPVAVACNGGVSLLRGSLGSFLPTVEGSCLLGASRPLRFPE